MTVWINGWEVYDDSIYIYDIIECIRDFLSKKYKKITDKEIRKAIYKREKKIGNVNIDYDWGEIRKDEIMEDSEY